MLEFELRRQECVELVRSHKLPEAVKYARTHVGDLTLDLEPDDYRKSVLKHLMVSMAYYATESEIGDLPIRYQDLFSVARWQQLEQLFQSTYENVCGLPRPESLLLACRIGLGALKTPDCDPLGGSPDCPCCAGALRQFAAALPPSRAAHSSLICRISGRLMDDANPATVLPNGQVYSHQALSEMAERQRGRVTCPVTGTTFAFSACKKIFVL
jgi:macrophage erythroblast attacher